jgi:hypothetical protein
MLISGINWNTLRTQTAPIIPEKKSDTDTDSFVRIQSKLDEKEKQNPFAFFPKDGAEGHDEVKRKHIL